MKYYKYEGSHWTTAYAVSEDSPEIRVLEMRYKGTNEDRVLETVFAYVNTPQGGSYDVLSAETIKTYSSMLKKEWQDFERIVREFVKNVGNV